MNHIGAVFHGTVDDRLNRDILKKIGWCGIYDFDLLIAAEMRGKGTGCVEKKQGGGGPQMFYFIENKEFSSGREG